MINYLKKYRKEFLLILLLTIFIYPLNTVKADGVFGGGSAFAGPTSGGDSGGGGAGNAVIANTGAVVYIPMGQNVDAGSCVVIGDNCQHISGVSYLYAEVNWNMFDRYNNNIIDQTTVNSQITAGTAIGFKIQELRQATWYGIGNYTIELLCTWTEVIHHQARHCWLVKGGGLDCYDTSYDEIKVHQVITGGPSYSADCTAAAQREGYEKAVAAVSGGASYTMTITNPNDARCANPEKYAEQLKRDGVDCAAEEGTASAVEGSLSGYNPVSKSYYYEMYGACINVKTGKVRYLNKDDKCGTNEYYIANDNESESTRHWHVFTPLNTKSTEGYSIILTPNKNTVQDKGICANIVEKYSKNNEYMNYIKPAGGAFVGNSKTDSALVKRVGCYFEMTLKVPTTQKFYGEEINGNDSTLTGFAFYYRPIDITNPFPNGVASDSYWQEWNEKNQKDPDLSESFDEVTYETNGIDLSYIREYNDQNNYTSWLDMNINGTSTFINSSKIINRSSTLQSDNLYNLGCGPTNMCEYYLDSNGTKKKNPIYQSECANTRKGVSCP